MIKTRNVSSGLYKNYLAKAEEYFQAMNDEWNKRRFNSAVLCAIHCGISAADALTVFLKYAFSTSADGSFCFRRTDEVVSSSCVSLVAFQ